MSYFTYFTERPEVMTVNAVLEGVERMLERIGMEAPKDPKEARIWKFATYVAVNALRRGEWQR